MAVYNVKSLSFTKGDNTYNIDAGSSYYAVCSTAGSTQIKTVTIDEITALEEGLSVRIIFSNDQLYNGVPKLQINSLTAANIQSVAGVDGEQYMWKAGEVIDLVYNGTNWIVVGRGATPSTRIIQVNTTVTNTSGSYTTTIQDARITSDMKALSLEISNPYVFNDKITVTCTNGSVTFACNDVCGTSAVTINIVKAALDATTITSEEFDTLDAEKLDKTDFFATEMPMSSSDATKVSVAISAIESNLDDKQDATDNNLSTTAKTVVGAINENASGITSNSEAITNINNKQLKLISVTSISDLETQLNTIGVDMPNGSFQNICITTGSSMTVLGASDRYVGQITKTYDDRYQIWLNRNAGNEVMHGTKKSTGWEWTELITKLMSSGNATVNTSYVASTSKIHWEKVGRTVTVYMEDVNTVAGFSGNNTIFSGLPSPSTAVVFALCSYNDNKAYRFRLGYDGTVTNYWSTLPTNATLYGVITYFTS